MLWVRWPAALRHLLIPERYGITSYRPEGHRPFSDEGLFYLFPIQDVSTLQQAKAHLTCAIDVLSHPEECSPEQRLDAVRTLNSLVAALSVHDDDHYSAFDSALEGGNVQ